MYIQNQVQLRSVIRPTRRFNQSLNESADDKLNILTSGFAGPRNPGPSAPGTSARSQLVRGLHCSVACKIGIEAT